MADSGSERSSGGAAPGGDGMTPVPDGGRAGSRPLSGGSPEPAHDPGELHRRSLVVDLHVDTPTTWLEDPEYALGGSNPAAHVDLPRLRDGGVDGVFFVAWVEPPFQHAPGHAFERARAVLERTREAVVATRGMRVVESAAGLAEARGRDEVGVFLAVEGGHAIEASLERLATLRELGVRYMTLTWNDPNEWADACCSPPVHGGLTAFGREVVREMERLGVLPDLSHAADTTFWDTLDELRGPALVSHSCARALVDHPRNLTDDMIRAVADTGGVIGVNFFPGFLDRNFAGRMLESDLHELLASAGERSAEAAAEGPHAALAAYRKIRQRTGKVLGRIPRPPVDRIVDHVEHMIDLVGPAHVGLGTDLDGIQATPLGVDHAGDLPVVTEALLDRGFRSDEVRMILGGNVMRVIEAAER